MENKEVTEIKTKYKKMRNTILMIVLTILVILLITLSVKTAMIQKLFKANLSESLGNNYKIIRTDYGGSEIYVKDNIKLQINNEVTATLAHENQGYLINYNTKEYCETPLEVSMFTRENMVISNYITITSESVNSFFRMAGYVVVSGMKIGTEEVNGVECYTITLKDNSMKMWFDKQSKLIIKEGYSGSFADVKIETGVVTDEDIKLPWEMGFTKKDYYIESK